MEIPHIHIRVPFVIISLCIMLIPACIDYSALPLPTIKPKGMYHTVQKNQTLWRICQTYHVDMQEVAELNNIKQTYQIKAGDRIFIPGAEKPLYVPPTVTGPKIDSQTRQAPRIVSSTGMFIWPLRGTIIKSFGISQGIKHDGINIRAAHGAPVKAACSGNVVFASYLEGYGNIIILEHKHKYATVYANNHANLVKEGQWVKQGQQIATTGASSGSGTAAYLHFQIRRWNRPRNPLFYLPKPG